MESTKTTYVVAVSGGVDSIVLLHWFRSKYPAVPIVVAHFDHGTRPDSADDRRFVEGLAHVYELPFEYGEAELGPAAGEAAARQARYDFLWQMAADRKAAGIVTAHHQDDVLETMILNMRRGTGRRGLSSLRDTPGMRRPLLHMSKAAIYEYAVRHGLEWREDPTNSSNLYRRNRIRHYELPRLGRAGRRKLLERHHDALRLNEAIEILLDGLLDGLPDPAAINRTWYRGLPAEIRPELLAAWLRRQGIREFDRLTIARLGRAIEAYLPGKLADAGGNRVLRVSRHTVRLGVRTGAVPRQTPVASVY